MNLQSSLTAFIVSIKNVKHGVVTSNKLLNGQAFISARLNFQMFSTILCHYLAQDVRLNTAESKSISRVVR